MPTFTVNAVVFYDENGDGVMGGDEVVRLAGVRVIAGTGSGVSAPTTGRVAVANVPEGPRVFSVDPTTLPPSFKPGAPVTVAVPATAEIAVPLILPIGDNRPNIYMGFGDSITVGRDGSSDGQGYLLRLENRLRAFWGAGEVIDRGVDGSKTTSGISRIDSSLRRDRPAYALIHYGTNDWNDRLCRAADPPCYTAENLRSIVAACKRDETIPVLATIIPVNVGFDARVPITRQEWVADIDRQIRAIATAEGAILADMEKAFLADPDLASLFADHVHPSDKGYELMADVWLKAITTAPAKASHRSFGPSRTILTLPGMGTDPGAAFGTRSAAGRERETQRQ